MTKAEAGKKGEEFCANYYNNHGFEVVERNYHSRFGEADVIARSEELLVFVEVKTRKEDPLVSGVESVDEAKKKKCVLTAMDYVSKHPTEKGIRFDVFVVVHNGERLVGFRKIENAFEFDEGMTDCFFF